MAADQHLFKECVMWKKIAEKIEANESGEEKKYYWYTNDYKRTIALSE
jgi:hypothetical protein